MYLKKSLKSVFFFSLSNIKTDVKRRSSPTACASGIMWRVELWAGRRKGREMRDTRGENTSSSGGLHIA